MAIRLRNRDGTYIYESLEEAERTIMGRARLQRCETAQIRHVPTIGESRIGSRIVIEG